MRLFKIISFLVSGVVGASILTIVASSPGGARTPTVGVPGKPVAVKAGSVVNGVVMITWSPPSSNGGHPITGYVVTASTKDRLFHSGCTTRGATSCSLSGLTKAQRYRVYVQASNILGPGRRSSVLKVNPFTSENCSHFAPNANLEACDLANVNLAHVNLSGANLTGANLSNANLSHANLTDATLRYVNLDKATLTGANVTSALLGFSNLDGIVSGGIVGSATLPRFYLLDNGYFLGPAVVATCADLAGLYLVRADLSGANLSNANLSGANLFNANIDANLTGANLRGADLSAFEPPPLPGPVQSVPMALIATATVGPV